MNSILAEHLLDWYAQNARDLPWRHHSHPYAVWVSEVMLQQTRVETVISYYERWMERFPTLMSLAQASQQEVLALWEGMGYYSRARNLHQAAQIVMRDYHGSLPSDVKLLRRLPGIGRYTAGAIASIAFGLDEPTLDGNIRRVLARLFNVIQDTHSLEGERFLWELAEKHLPIGDAGDFNQAMMDLGASICTPRTPQCGRCPLAQFCQANALSLQEQRPITKVKPDIPHHTVTAAVIQQDGFVLIAQRPLNGLLGGMWEFPGGKLQPGEDLANCLQREIREELGVEIRVGEAVGVYQHAYTHFRVTLHAFDCSMKDRQEPLPLQVRDVRWVLPVNLLDFPMGKIDRQIASHLYHIQEAKSILSDT